MDHTEPKIAGVIGGISERMPTESMASPRPMPAANPGATGQGKNECQRDCTREPSLRADRLASSAAADCSTLTGESSPKRPHFTAMPEEEKIQPLPLQEAEGEAFDVKAAMDRSRVVIHPNTTSGHQNIVIFTLNMAGLRTKYKKESLRALAHHLQFTIGIITETNLLKPEVDALQIPGYRIIDDQGTSKHCGGVLIMAKVTTPCRKVTRTQRPPDPINTCSVLLSPTGLEEYSLQITGIYIPPSALAVGEQLITLTDPGCRETAKSGEPLSHLLIGDFNPNCWRENEGTPYQEWVMEHGLWDLANPNLPTYKTGSSLDKMLLCPGRDIPAEWLGTPASLEMDGVELPEEMDAPYYPARVFLEPWVADHHPLQLTLNSEPVSEGVANKVLKINDLTPEDWQIKDMQFQEFWDNNHRKVQNAIRYKNPTRLLDILYQGLRQIFAEQMQAPKGRKKKKDQENEKSGKKLSPFQVFCKRHKSHPDYPAMISAVQRQDAPLATRLMGDISRDGWRDYLGKVHPSDISAFFRYLAKEDGRQSRQNFYSCMAPLKDAQGVRHYDSSKKCALLADHMQQKLAIKPLDLQLPTESAAPDLHKGLGTQRVKPRPGKRVPKKPMVPNRLVREPFDTFSATEVYKAVHGLSKKKASGPDGFMVEVYQNMPGVLPPLRQLFNLVLETGHLPLPMLKLHIVPLEKPQKDPEECGAKRPISLLNTISKVLESLVLVRMINGADMDLDGRQYAYRPHRGTETHLTEFHDFVREAYNKGERIYVAAVDVDSAFDNVPHNELIRTAMERKVDLHICRYLEAWLKQRIFSIRLTTPTGRFFSNWRSIEKGVPQGGVLSPYLWLLHIDKLFKGVESRRRQQLCELPPGSLRFLDSLYADDILCAIAHKSQQVLTSAAHVSARAYEDSLSDLGLATTIPKSENFIIERVEGEETLFRRNLQDIQRTTASPEMPHVQENIPIENPAVAPMQPVTVTAEHPPAQQNASLPYTEVAKMKILGVVFDKSFSFTDHYHRILEKARVRMGVIAKLSSRKWGLETRMLRLTGQSLVVSLLRYGFVVTGSGMSDAQMRFLNTRLLNPLARRIVGVGPSARLPVLFAMAGILNSYNLYIRQCSETLNLILRASGSSAGHRVKEKLAVLYGVPSWQTSPHCVEQPCTQFPLIGYLKFLDYDVAESWTLQLLEATPHLSNKYWVRSVYCSDAKEISSKPNLLSLTYTFQEATSWMDTAVQTLTASGWRPDCSVAAELDLTKVLPLKPEMEKIHVSTECPSIPLEHAGAMRMQQGETTYQRAAGASGMLTIYVGAFYQDGFGASVACFCMPNGIPSTQSWGLGFDLVSKEPPAFVLEASILHALLLAESLTAKMLQPPPDITISVGTRRTCMLLYNWQKYGRLALESAAADEIVKVWHRLNKVLPCVAQFQALPWTFFEGSHPWDSSVGGLLKAAAARFFQIGIPQAKTQWGNRIARIPWTTKELKRHLKRRYREDERVALELLAMEGSIAGANYCQMGLNRAVLKESLRRLHHNRRHQVILANIICATRFKFFDETGTLLQVQCPNGCGGVDSLDHLLQCYRLGQISPESAFDERVSFLRDMAVRTAHNCPVLPIPIPASPSVLFPAELEVDELSLTNTEPGSEHPDEPEDGEGISWTLELEFDTT